MCQLLKKCTRHMFPDACSSKSSFMRPFAAQRGYMIPNVFVSNVNTAIDSVLFPVLSGEQSSRDKVRNMTCRSIRVSSYSGESPAGQRSPAASRPYATGDIPGRTAGADQYLERRNVCGGSQTSSGQIPSSL